VVEHAEIDRKSALMLSMRVHVVASWIAIYHVQEEEFVRAAAHRVLRLYITKKMGVQKTGRIAEMRFAIPVQTSQ